MQVQSEAVRQSRLLIDSDVDVSIKWWGQQKINNSWERNDTIQLHLSCFHHEEKVSWRGCNNGPHHSRFTLDDPGRKVEGRRAVKGCYATVFGFWGRVGQAMCVSYNG